MAGSPEIPLTDPTRFPNNPATPSRKTGRSGITDRSESLRPTEPATPSRKTGRFGEVGEAAPDARWSELRPPELVDPALPVPTADMPKKGVRVARRRRLQRIAALQNGLFTRAQALEAGLDRRARHHHLSYGNWRRTDAPYVFRLAGWPADEHERLRAWLLWAGPGAHLTSWTALGLANVVGSGPRVPVDLEIPFSRGRAGQRRRGVMERQLGLAGGPESARLHRAVVGESDVIDGLRVRPPAEAMCAAISDRPRSIALGMALALLDAGRFRHGELLLASNTTRCGPLADAIFERLDERRARRGAS